MPDGPGAVNSTAIDDLSNKGREIAVVEAGGDLGGRDRTRSRDVNRLVRAIGCAWVSHWAIVEWGADLDVAVELTSG